MEEIINKVAESKLTTFDLEDFYTEGKRIPLDISIFYDEDEILREKLFREALKNHNWQQYQDNLIYIFDGRNSILPAWTMLLVSSFLVPFSKFITFGTKNDLERELFITKLTKVDFSSYKDQKVIVKGCSKKEVPTSAYVFVIQQLQPIVFSLMYGEACSSVPLFKSNK